MAEPGFLAFGELAGAEFDQLDGFWKGALSTQVFDNLSIADGLHGGLVLFEAFGEQMFGFLDKASFEHLVDPGVNARVQIGWTALEIKKSGRDGTLLFVPF